VYSYTYDPDTGGILLNYTPTGFSKEPRPVYAPELDLLGFDQHWLYDKQDEYPYMWAEANTYWYRGKLVARLKGGNLYTAPEITLPLDEKGNTIAPEAEGVSLRPIDMEAMVEANREIMDIVEGETLKQILEVYEKYRNRLDCFHVAFSGGKDSVVLLDLVKKALPQGSFIVLFADTGMEFPDTYTLIDEVARQCEKEKIPFYTAKSHLDPKESWTLFGPPSRVLRWCCSVHKSAPQTIMIRKLLNKNDFRGLDYVGVRRHESVTRNKYTQFNYGKKQKGQYSHNSILEWSSAEVWLYILSNRLMINQAYKRGNARAGCLFCPVSGGISNFFRGECYQSRVNQYTDMIAMSYGGKSKTAERINTYINNGGWNARKNGRDLHNNPSKCTETLCKGYLLISVSSPSSNWKEWIKTIGQLSKLSGKYSLLYEEKNFDFYLIKTEKGYDVSISESYLKTYATFGKLFRQVFRKAAYCENCSVCVANCKNGCISFPSNKVKISGCVQCKDCHDIDSGCLLFHSVRHPQGGGTLMMSLNSFADHAPKIEWLQSFFRLQNVFFTDHSLGPMMYSMFRRFLRDALLIEKNQCTSFAELIAQIGWEREVSWGLILLNLAHTNPQIQWYIEELDLDSDYSRATVEKMLVSRDVKPKDAKSIIKSFARLCAIPLGTNLNFGHVTTDGSLVRTRCRVEDPLVILYGLFKFAEQCGDYKEFTLSILLNDSIERDGLSPSRIFGLNRDDMRPFLKGLSAKYSDFIHAAFTHDLEKITLSQEKSSADVLDLFRKEYCNES
jgi:phosphoadenosine phosphosulfate reductase